MTVIDTPDHLADLPDPPGAKCVTEWERGTAGWRRWVSFTRHDIEVAPDKQVWAGVAGEQREDGTLDLHVYIDGRAGMNVSQAGELAAAIASAHAELKGLTS